MNKETSDILNSKDGKDAKQLLDFCSTPKTPIEVSKNIKNFDVIVKLMKSGAIVFKDGKYVAVDTQ